MTAPQGQKSSCGMVPQPEHCKEKMAHLEKEIKLQFAAIKAEYDKAAATLDDRLASLNDHKAEMTRLRDSLATKDDLSSRLAIAARESELKYENLLEKVQSQQMDISEARGKASAVSVYISWLLAVAALVVSLLAVLK